MLVSLINTHLITDLSDDDSYPLILRGPLGSAVHGSRRHRCEHEDSGEEDGNLSSYGDHADGVWQTITEGYDNVSLRESV